MRRLTALSTLLVVASATALAAQTPAAPLTVAARGTTIRAGTWDLQLTMGGGTLDASMIVTVANDSLGVTVFVGDHPSPVRATSLRGARLVLESPAGGTQVRYELEFRGDEVTGTFTYEGTPGPVTGRRRAAGR